MKIITDSRIVRLANDFAEMREAMKAMEASQKQARTELLSALGDENSALVGVWLLILSERVRTDLDRTALAEALGEEFYKFTTRSSYEVLDIKKA